MIDRPNNPSPDEPETEASASSQATMRKAEPAGDEAASPPPLEQERAAELPETEGVASSPSAAPGIEQAAGSDPPVALEAGEDPSERDSASTALRGAMIRKRHARMSLGLVAGGLAAALVCGLAVRQYVAGAQREVASELPSVAADGDRVTAIAWAPYQGGPLFLGTARGRVYRKVGTSVAEPLPPNRSSRDGEPIVAIHPAQVRATAADVEWVALDPRASSDGAAYRTTEGVHTRNGLAAIYGGRLLAVVEGDQQPAAAVSKKAPPPARADARGMIDDSFDSDSVSAIAMATIRGGTLTRAIQAPQAGDRAADRLVLGYRDGSIRLVDASAKTTFSVVGPVADASVAADRSVVAIATPFDQARDLAGRADTRISNVLFASAHATGDVHVYRGESGNGPLSDQVLSMRSDKPPSPVRPVQDGLFVSADGRILMLYGPHGLMLANLDDAQLPVQAVLYRPEELGRKPEAEDITGLRISAAALSSRGDVFAVAANDGTIRIVTVPARLEDLQRAEFFTIAGHSDVIVRVAISSDGGTLASLGVDGRVWITDIARARQLSRWPFRDLPSGPQISEMQAVAFQMPQAPPPSRRLPQLIVAFGADDSLEAAQAEINRARAAGFTDLGIYSWGNKFNSVARFPDGNSQREGLARLRGLSRWSRDAYQGVLSTWCPSPTMDDNGVTRCDNDTRTKK